MERAPLPSVSVITLPALRILLAVLVLVLVRARLYLPALLLAGLLVIVECASLLSRLGMHRLRVAATLDPLRLFPEETGSVRVDLHNGKRFPATIFWRQPLPVDGLQPLPAEGLMPLPDAPSTAVETCVRLASHGAETLHLPLRAQRRGVYPLPPLLVWTADPFGLFRRQLSLDHPEPLIVFPAPTAAESLPLSASDLAGSARSPRPFFYDPVRTVGLKDYDPTLPARHIHWKASARRGRLLARVLESSSDRKLLLTIDLSDFCTENEGDGSHDRFEKTLSMAAALVLAADAARIPFGFAANAAQTGRDGAICLPVTRSAGQAGAVLEALARAECRPVGTLAGLLAAEAVHIPWGTTVLSIGPDRIEEVAP